ncbi:MAG: hypothetical protein IJ689_02325 [Alphaproteobacteria bacterium]|nr:hypothetical protein [Alphaproteobacteria bacterium]
MNKYILMLGVAGVALGSYCAYASNSATMTVTATIAHDVSLVATSPLNMGTLTIDPSDATGSYINLNGDGTTGSKGGGIISLTGFSAGTFTANVPDSCKVDDVIAHNYTERLCFRAGDINLGGVDFIEPSVSYVSGNTFKFMYDIISYEAGIIPTSGDYSQNVTIEYTL